MGVGGSTRLCRRSPYPRERDAVRIVQKVGWASGTVWTGVEKIETLALTVVRTPSR